MENTACPANPTICKPKEYGIAAVDNDPIA